MKKIQYNIFERDSRNASSKAKNDVSIILKSENFENLYNPSYFRLIRIIQQFFCIITLPKNCSIIVQYQSNVLFFYRLLNRIKLTKKVAIIHDLESLRGNISLEKEISILNTFDFIVSHNHIMTKYLLKNGYTGKVYNLDIFDYLYDNKIKIKIERPMDQVFFAGNLEKSSFIMNLKDINNLKFNLYGKYFDKIQEIANQENVIYKGSFNATDLIAELEGAWGLVWDGNSLDTCDGVVGHYMKYNNPHKVSMCIVSERPIIIWDKSAMAEYIKNNKLGVLISNLRDLSVVLNGISHEDYIRMVNNVKREKEKIINGQSLRTIIREIFE